MKKVSYRNYYRVEEHGNYVAVNFIVVANYNGEEETLIFNEQGSFKTIDEAQEAIIDYLEEMGADIERVVYEGYDGLNGDYE